MKKEKTESNLTKKIKALEIKAKKKARQKLSSDEIQLELSLGEIALWNDTQRVLPNDLARTNLFSPKDKKISRETRHDFEKVISTNSKITVLCKGSELRNYDDQLIWQQLLQYSKEKSLNEKITFTRHQLCNDLTFPLNGNSYKKIDESLTRLQTTVIQITHHEKNAFKSISLIKGFGHEKIDAKTTSYYVELDPNLVNLFSNNNYSKLEWNIYLKLSPRAKKLYDYVASHKHPFSLKLALFKELCESTSNDRLFKSETKKVCKELVDSGLLNKCEIVNDKIDFAKKQQLLSNQ